MITESDKMQIFSNLLEENDLKKSERTSTSENMVEVVELKIAQPPAKTDQKKIKLKTITHISGVNALDSKQPIAFSDACTVFYGLNGTGKSGYFRIIHELSGGDKAKTILSNIYKPAEALEVDVDFCTGNERSETYKWRDRNTRDIHPFNQIKVFDSEYLPIFLDKRESSVNIEPLGLHLFQIITSTIDEFKDKLEELTRIKKNDVPNLESLINTIHSETFKLLFQKTTLSVEESKLLAEMKCFSEKEGETLAELKKQKQTLEKDNTAASCKVLNQEIEDIAKLNTKLHSLKTEIQELTENIFDANNECLKARATRDARATQFEILKEVPAIDSDEWQAFIQSANEYGRILDSEFFNKDKKCIHCHQPLSERALTLVQTYSRYLNDESQQNYKKATNKIAKLNEVLNSLDATFDLSENLKNILKDVKNEKNETYENLVNQISRQATHQKEQLKELIKGNTSISYSQFLCTHYIHIKLEEIMNAKKEMVTSLQQSETKKKQTIDDLVKIIKELEDKQTITKFKTQIETYFILSETINKIVAVNQGIGTTRTITTLGTTAHDDLLTESIRKSFEQELHDLGKDIKVTLEPAGSGKGSVFTKLKILGNDVSSILSDGEKKAVGLALFLAEIQNSNDLSPIVYDDPVTSLDHDVADDLAKKMLQLSETRQIIIFTHNKLFKDSLIYWGSDPNQPEGTKKLHVCKNYSGGCSTKGRHVLTYEMRRNSSVSTGIVIPFKIQNFNYFLAKAKKLLENSEYDENDVAGNLRLAIDHYVDEKILANNMLRKDKQRNHNTNFENLKALNPDAAKIDKLASYYSMVSGNGGIHQYQDYQLNSMKKEDFLQIVNFLEG